MLRPAFTATVLLLLAAACQSHTSTGDLPYINSVEAVATSTATAEPLSPNTFWVKGRIGGKLYLLGKGAFELTDISDESNSIVIVSQHNHRKGKVVTIRIKKLELINVSDNILHVYAEEKLTD